MRLEDLEGKVVAERFQLKEMIGKGGYGAVFEAIQLSVGRRCAVKILLPGRGDDEQVEERFRAEARSTSRLTHPNSIVLYDFGVDSKTGYLFLATEFIDGFTLHQILEVRKTLSVERSLRILEQVAGSLDDAHALGLVHRDIKPKNIMILERAGQQDFVKVIDFGIAKALGGDMANDDDGLTKTGMLIGTPQYMAPEQLLGSGMDPRVDQYALAVVGYKMLTGRNPFSGSSPMETAMRHINDRPLPLRTYRPELEVRAEFEDVFLKALAKLPEHRFESILSFVNALRESAGDLSARGEKEQSLFGEVDPALLQRRTLMLDTGSLELDEPQHETAATAAMRPGAARQEKPTVPAEAVPAEERPTKKWPEPPVEESSQEPTSQPRRQPLETASLKKTAVTKAVPRPRKVTVPDPEQVKQRQQRITLEPVSPESVELAARVEDPETGVHKKKRGQGQRGPSPVVLLVAGLSTLFFSAVVLAIAITGGPGAAQAEPEAPGHETAVVDSRASAVALIEEEAAAEPAAEEQEAPVDLTPALDEAKDSTFQGVEQATSAARAKAEEIEEERRQRLARRPARVNVTLIPWGTLYVNGEARSDATRQELSLRPGRYELTLRQQGEVRARRTVDVRGGQSKMVVLEARFD